MKRLTVWAYAADADAVTKRLVRSRCVDVDVLSPETDKYLAKYDPSARIRECESRLAGIESAMEPLYPYSKKKGGLAAAPAIKADREAFAADRILPEDILWRQKAAFSDAVGHSMVDDLKEYAESLYTDEEYEEKRKQYSFATPFTKESLLYRELFEKYYPGQAEMVKDFWMPNKDWEGCDVKDPSARVLSNYGASGV